MSASLPDVQAHLNYLPGEMNPALSTGLWFVDNPIEAGALKTNACCLYPDGNWDDLDGCENFFGAFPYIVIAIPNETHKAEAISQFQARIRSVPIAVVQPSGFRGKTVEAIVSEGGTDAVWALLGYCVDLPGYGLLNLADVKRPPNIPHVKSGIAELDRALGGFSDGELTVWTGRRGEGKSTFLGQVLLAAREQGRTVCAYSGELPAWRFKEWLSIQAAGPLHIQRHMDEDTGHEFYVVAQGTQENIDAWFDRRFILLDNAMPDANDPEQIVSAFKLAQRQYGASVFLADNLMSADISTAGDKDFYRAQSAFVGRLVAFCKATGTHVHLVSHPRKTDGKRALDADDVAGTGEIVNRADNAISLARLSDEDAARQGYSTMLSVLKNRQYGSRAKIGLTFDEPSRRFSGRTVDAIHHQYPWAASAEFAPLADHEPLPFSNENQQGENID